MDHQLRIYKIEDGRLDDFLTLWREHIVAARAAHGFEVVASYVNRDANEFAWIVRADGDFAAADARYYEGPERAALPWNPKDAITGMELRMLEVYKP